MHYCLMSRFPPLRGVVGHQVGSHFVYDAVGNWVMNPLQDKVVEMTGLQGAVNSYNHLTGQAVNDVRWYQRLYNEFYR